ncbi:iron citrate ABC transporter substrate-binding protein [Kitasatospora herbaricolor]|uniref:ABC transporter substrate-binding protein n=1 Tax=Kitasatospora herbaricolor TaxID=68217 RepID=UPI00174CBA66|nr:ABC transporter substrate-binding protein [Kitasatospora herbaricolor]MDQ0311356.1 iron complex transport system substrate-binding protein [Kitasatospora herbaricolor]GGV22892.1 iron citrate ABC transporter substrate-binding protein [Kitasatospora herbaricolor]
MNTRVLTSRSLRVAAVAATAALTLAACGSNGDSKDAAGAPSAGAATAAGPVVVEATNGRITVPAGVKRIVSISYATGALLDLGVQPVGTSTIDENNPMELLPSQTEAAKKIEPIGSGIEINIEKVASLKPDLIVVEGATAFDWGVKKLEGIAPTLYFGIDKPVDLLTAQEKIATAVGKDAEFKKLKADYDGKAAKIKADYAAKLNTVKWTIASSYGGGEFLVDTSSSWVGRVLADAGATFAQASADPAEHEVTYSTEKLDVLADADIILIPRTAATGEVPQDTKDLDKQPSWKNLKAVQAGKVLPVTYATTDRYGTSTDVLNQVETILKGL